MNALIATAFAAGLVSTVNPCGFAMLPAYLGYFLGAGAGVGRRWPSVVVSVSAGFILVFGLAGTLVAVGLRSIIGVIPWLAGLVGIGLVVVGLGLVTGRAHLPALPTPGRVRKTTSMRGMFVFGISYAVASLSCTLPIFLSLVAGTLVGEGGGRAVAAFFAYGIGMGLSLGVITLAVAAGRQGLVRRIRRVGRHLNAVSGWVMVVAGGFIVWYWATVLRLGATALSTSVMVAWADRAAAFVAGVVVGEPVLIASIAVLVMAWGLWWNTRRGTGGGPEG